MGRRRKYDFIDDRAEESGEEGEGEEDDEEEGDVDGLLAEVTEQEKDGEHLRAGATVRNAELDREMALMEAAEERYTALGATYMQPQGAGAGAGGGDGVGSVLDADTELGELARAARDAAQREAEARAKADAAAARARAKAEAESKAKQQQALSDLYELEAGADDGVGSAPDQGPTRASTSHAPSHCAASASSASGGRYRIKKKAKTA